MNTTKTPDRFAALPDEDTLAATVTALEEHGFSVEVVDDLHGQASLGRGEDVHGALGLAFTIPSSRDAGATARHLMLVEPYYRVVNP